MDLTELQALLELLHQNDVSEFTYEDEHSRMKLRLGQHVVMAPAAPVHVAAPVAAAAAAPVDDHLTAVVSPMVGTFYRSPAPDKAQYVQVGSKVTAGDVLCIVEAMKLMNEIEAEVSGVIAEILVDNGTAVQFGQALFKIRPG